MKSNMLRGLLLAAALSCPPAWAAQSQSLQGLVNIRFQNDVRLFTVMAALNAAGFDAESEGRTMSEVRLRVREELSGLDPELVGRLRQFYLEKLEGAAIDHPQTAYTSLALLLSGPPGFELASAEENLPADARHVAGFERLLPEFYRKAGVPKLWEKYRPAYERELLAYEPLLREIITETLEYFRVPARVVLDREIVLIPDLLDQKDIVNARNLERVYYIVAGPADDPRSNRRQLQHEYLHFLVDPLVRKFGLPLMDHEDLLDLAQRQPHIRSEYQNRYLLMVTESLIESLQTAIAGGSEQQRQRELVEDFRQGLILAPYFHRGLASYGRSEMVSLPTFMESLLAGVDPREVRRDEEQIAELEQQLLEADQASRAEAEQARGELQRRQRIGSLFRDATEALRAGQLESAEESLRALLELEPDHGGSWFYLGQIAVQRQQYPAALEAYRRSAEAPGAEAWVRAWSLLRMGRIRASRGEFEEARRLFESVRQLEGDLQGARQEAEESLALLEGRP